MVSATRRKRRDFIGWGKLAGRRGVARSMPVLWKEASRCFRWPDDQESRYLSREFTEFARHFLELRNLSAAARSVGVREE
jgi:hypothetical protein